MTYGEATATILEGMEKKPEEIDELADQHGLSTYQAIRYMTALLAPDLAPKFISGEIRGPSHAANVLDGWHDELHRECRSTYFDLTSSVRGFSRTEANAHPELLTIQALRRGVRDAIRLERRLHLHGSPEPAEWPAHLLLRVNQWAADV